MPKRWIEKEEWYPVYEFRETSVYGYADGPFEASFKELAEYKRVFAEFDKLQKKLDKMIETERARKYAKRVEEKVVAQARIEAARPIVPHEQRTAEILASQPPQLQECVWRECKRT